MLMNFGRLENHEYTNINLPISEQKSGQHYVTPPLHVFFCLILSTIQYYREIIKN